MDRRKYLKTLAVGTISASVLLDSCQPTETKPTQAAGPPPLDRQPLEKAREEKLKAEQFFDPHELATITVLVDIIIPRDDVSGSASDAKVPDFIEFMAKDRPEHQIPLRGGLKWLDVQSSKRFNKVFTDCSASQQIEIVDDIAFPEQAKPGMEQGVAFFNLVRNLTATGFFTSEMGIKDLGYVGNRPNQWDGVPQEVLDQYGIKYDERTLNESVRFDS
ncbi:MAG: gluconate 2-dehydrogenase subunit 3 family protein [Cyclobacteriaceae bacterium]|nr:gluconate 2-dehydrogenase subunit 3 family protein [Cyclobacteriaceae bacterium]